jgi:hypothetical protein
MILIFDRLGDFVIAILLAVCLIASFVLGFRDIWIGQATGGLFPVETLLYGVALFWLFLLAGSVALNGHTLTGLGMLFLGNSCLLRLSSGVLLGSFAVSTIVVFATSIYLATGLLGLICMVLGWRRGEQWLTSEKSVSVLPSWLRSSPQFPSPTVRDYCIDILALAGGVMSVYILARFVWPSSVVLPIVILGLICILGLAAVALLVRRTALHKAA